MTVPVLPANAAATFKTHTPPRLLSGKGIVIRRPVVEERWKFNSRLAPTFPSQIYREAGRNMQDYFNLAAESLTCETGEQQAVSMYAVPFQICRDISISRDIPLPM